MDEAGKHHSQETNTRTKNQTPHVLIHKWELNSENTWTQGWEHHTLVPVAGWGPRGGIALGEIPNVGEGEKKSKAHCHVCTYATILHALLMYPKTYNPIKNLKTIKK